MKGKALLIEAHDNYEESRERRISIIVMDIYLPTASDVENILSTSFLFDIIHDRLNMISTCHRRGTQCSHPPYHIFMINSKQIVSVIYPSYIYVDKSDYNSSYKSLP